MVNGTSKSSSNEDLCPNPRIQSYRIRWAIIFILALINGSNSFLWISFAPIADHFVAFYETNESILNLIQMIFPITTVVFGLIAALFVDWLGLRATLLSSASLNLICGILRMISSVPSNSNTLNAFRLPLIIIGQIVASFAQPLCMFSPTKMALVWFPDSQRTIANTIGSFGNPFGILVGSLITPFIVQKQSDMFTFNLLSFVLVGLGFLFTVICVRRGQPLHPPSVAAMALERIHELPSGETQSSRRIAQFLARMKRFMQHLIAPLRVWSFWLLLAGFGCGLAYFTALSTLFEQILCAKGYSNEFAGVAGCLMIAGGILASPISAVFVDRTGLLLETMKVCYLLSLVGAVGLSVALWLNNFGALILFCITWLGSFGFAQYSVCLELAAEATYPVPEAISTSLLIIASQILSVLFIPFLQGVAPVMSINDSPVRPTCGPASTPQDYAMPNMVICCFIVLLGIVQLFMLKLPYKRRECSKRMIRVDTLSDQEFPVEDIPSI